jgi:hypothetical protein
VRRGRVGRGQLVRVTEGPVTEQQRHDDHDCVEAARSRRRGEAPPAGAPPTANPPRTSALSSQPPHDSNYEISNTYPFLTYPPPLYKGEFIRAGGGMVFGVGGRTVAA